jgi:3-oxoacyl-[acyl-carrier protein] reductase
LDLGLAGRRALVWGGSRGLGFAIASRLAREGVAVTIAARTRATLEQAAETMGAALAVADITTADGRAAALAVCPEPDILVNNADGPPPGDFRDFSRDDWIGAMDAMMFGPIEMIRAVLDGMIARRFGRVVNITSRGVKAPMADLPLSNGARAGLTGFVGGIARQAIRYNVTINNLLPGAFATEAQRRHIGGLAAASGQSFDEIWQAREAANPAGRFGDPDEIGAWCAFICSAHSSFVTGQNFLIDGGWYPGLI